MLHSIADPTLSLFRPQGLWPKRTLEGVRSALSSRKIMSNISFVTLRFLRSMEHIAASEVVEAFELTLAKPVGINIEGNR